MDMSCGRRPDVESGPAMHDAADTTIRGAMPEDLEGVRAVVSSTLFPGTFLDALIRPYFEGSPEQRWLVATDSREVLGVAFFTPEPFPDGTWNLKAIGVTPNRQRSGIGHDLLGAVEDELRGLCARLLLIDTSSRDDQRPARLFYVKHEYQFVSTGTSGRRVTTRSRSRSISDALGKASPRGC